jgi:hypothetical protein
MPLSGHEANLPGGFIAMESQVDNEMALTYGLFMGAEGRSWRIRDPNATARDWSMDDSSTGITHSTLHQVWVRPAVVDVPPVEPSSTANLYPDCVALKAANASATSGMYFFNIGNNVVRAYCDMVTEGGGWMLVLNYVRGGGLDPVLQLRNRTAGFPLLRSTRLGTDESWMRGARNPWGHVDADSLAQARTSGAAALSASS